MTLSLGLAAFLEIKPRPNRKNEVSRSHFLVNYNVETETWRSWNGKRVRLEGVQALQARRGQKEQQEQQEQERQDNEQQQGESGESLPRIETASPYDRLCPCGAATRPRRAV